MSDRWIGVAPASAEADLVALLESGAPGPDGERVPFVRTEWAWRFPGGKTLSFDSLRGTTLTLANATMFGHLVVAVFDDRDGLVDLVTKRVPIEDVAQLVKRSEAAASDREKLDALLALTSAQSMTGGEPLPAFETAARRALADPSPVVRLGAIRSITILPPATAFALLEGVKDRDNPGLADWRAHYRKLMTQSS